MKNESRLKITDNIMEMMIKMSDGNPGAAVTCVRIIKEGDDIDPDSAFGGLGFLMILDSYGIYGTDIYVLFNDICDGDLVKGLSVLRAAQLGLFDSDILIDACHRQDRSGKNMVPVDDLYAKVKERLPNFNSKKI